MKYIINLEHASKEELLEDFLFDNNIQFLKDGVLQVCTCTDDKDAELVGENETPCPVHTK